MSEKLSRCAWAALSSRESLQATYDLTLTALRNGVPGDLVECGVFAGANTAAMAFALMESGIVGPRVHLFDSFEGIPAPTIEDPEWLESGNKPGTSTCSEAQTREYLKTWGVPEELLVWHPGWFADTVPVANIVEIAVLRLDGDLYESTKVCMEHLYPRVSPGGWVIVDDWHLSGARKAVEEKTSPSPVYFQRY